MGKVFGFILLGLVFLASLVQFCYTYYRRNKNSFKQLFCKHEWETRSNSVGIEDFNTHKKTIVNGEIHKVCKKCGKVIKK